MNENLSGPRVRRMQLLDLRAVEAIDLASFPQPWSIATYRYEVADNPLACCWVVEQDGAVAGALVGWLVMDEFRIGTLAVHPEQRRKGHARRLLSTALEDAVRNGAVKAMLEVRVGNSAAQSLYRGFGFRIVGRRRRLYADGEDGFLMDHDLVKDGIKAFTTERTEI